jgi:hypothetical protein
MFGALHNGVAANPDVLPFGHSSRCQSRADMPSAALLTDQLKPLRLYPRLHMILECLFGASQSIHCIILFRLSPVAARALVQ